MRVGLDLDNVVCDFTGHVNTLYEPWFGEPTPIVWDHWDAYKASPHFPDWQEFAIWANKARLWETMPFTPGALHAIDQLVDVGHQPVFLTARTGDQCILQTRYWFNENFGGRWDIIKPRDLYTGLGGGKYTVKCGVYVDDAVDELVSLRLQQKYVIKFAQPWNKTTKATAVAKNWGDVVSFIGAIS